MSSRLKARPPAWSGLAPNPESYHPAVPSVQASLCETLGIRGQALGRAPRSFRSESFFQFFPESNRQPLFLKIVDQERLGQQLAADRLAGWLHARGVRTSRLLPSFPQRFGKDRYLLGSRLIDGRPAGVNPKDLRELGRTLAQAHRQLKALPWREEIRRASEQRDREFRRARAGLLESARLDPELRAIILANQTDLPDGPAQVIHGDLNLGNVLFETKGHQPVLLDFEDAAHNYHHVSVDLAMAIERFVLVRHSADSSAFEAASELLSTYRRHTGLTWPKTGLGAQLRALSVRALVLLHMHRTPIDPGEQAKFVRLIGQTHQRSDLLERVQRL